MEALAPVFAFLSSAAPALGAVSSAVGLGKELFGGGGSAAPMAPAPTPASSPAQPSISPTDYRNNETAYWNQLLSGTGISPTGQLPDSIQQNIDRQASLLGG